MSIPSDSPSIKPVDIASPHTPPRVDGLGVFSEIFASSPQSDVKIVYERMVDYARESGVSDKSMVERVQKGFEIAKMIIKPGGEDYLIQSHPTEDLINLDWFFRAQMAKTNKLYIKGTVKFPDPDNRFLTFIVHTKSTFHGSIQEPRGRWTSHWPEHQDKTRDSTDLKLTDNTYVCFSEKAKKQLLKEGVNKSNIKNFDKAGICIDASGPKSNPQLGVPGKKNATYLIQSFQEKNNLEEWVQVIGIKAEGFSAVAITESKYGDVTDRVGDNVRHMWQWFEKKGPGKILSKSAPQQAISPYSDLKEDKLKKNLKEILKKIELIPKEKRKEGEVQEVLGRLELSYKVLETTTGGGSEFGIKELKEYLEILDEFRLLQIKFMNKLDHNKLSELHEQLDLIHQAISEIESLENYYRDQRIMDVWTHTLLPRSEEVILPTLDDMIKDKVPFNN